MRSLGSGSGASLFQNNRGERERGCERYLSTVAFSTCWVGEEGRGGAGGQGAGGGEAGTLHMGRERCDGRGARTSAGLGDSRPPWRVNLAGCRSPIFTPCDRNNRKCRAQQPAPNSHAFDQGGHFPAIIIEIHI